MFTIIRCSVFCVGSKEIYCILSFNVYSVIFCVSTTLYFLILQSIHRRGTIISNSAQNSQPVNLSLLKHFQQIQMNHFTLFVAMVCYVPNQSMDAVYKLQKVVLIPPKQRFQSQPLVIYFYLQLLESILQLVR